MAETIAFWSLAVVLVGSALAVVLSKNLFHSVLWLALALTGTAGVFLLLEAAPDLALLATHGVLVGSARATLVTPPVGDVFVIDSIEQQTERWAQLHVCLGGALSRRCDPSPGVAGSPVGFAS